MGGPAGFPLLLVAAAVVNSHQRVIFIIASTLGLAAPRKSLLLPGGTPAVRSADLGGTENAA